MESFLEEDSIDDSSFDTIEDLDVKRRKVDPKARAQSYNESHSGITRLQKNKSMFEFSGKRFLQPDIPAVADDITWMHKYQPRQLHEVSVHSRKLKDLETGLRDVIGGAKRLLVVTGPPGSGKSVAVRLLARKIMGDNSIIEWENPDAVVGMSRADEFGEFLNGVRYVENKIVVVKDLPNVYHEDTLLRFQKAVSNHVYSNLAPLVIVFSDFNVQDLYFSIDSIVGPEIMRAKYTVQVKFNPVNKTLMGKTLKKIINSERIFKAISNSVVNEYLAGLTNIGDIPAAINSLEFWARAKPKTGLDYSKLTQLDLYHLIGRLIFGSQKISSTSVAKNRLICDDIVDHNSYMQTNLNLMSLFLLENYCIYQKGHFNISQGYNIINDLSLCNNKNWHGNASVYFNILVRTPRVNLDPESNTKGSSSGSLSFHDKIVFPNDYKNQRKKNKIAGQIDFYREKNLLLSFNDCNLYQGYYESVINNQRLFKHRASNYMKKESKWDEWAVENNLLIVRLGGEINYDEITKDLNLSDCYQNYNPEDGEESEELEDDPIEEVEQYDEIESDSDLDCFD